MIICILTIVFFVLLFVLFIDIVIGQYGVFKTYKWSKMKTLKKNSIQSVNLPELLILLPALNEYEMVEQIINCFYEIKDNYNIKVIVITTEKETVLKEYPYTTQNYINIILGNYPDGFLSNIHYPFANGNKASQLNYAIKKIHAETDINLKNTYFAIYDIDSMPSKETISEFNELINSEYSRTNQYPIVVQQPSFFYKNFNKKNLIMQIEALAATRRVLQIEIPNQLQTNKPHKWHVPYAYCVGHGLFVYSDYLVNNGLFPEPHEDVLFGLKLSYLSNAIYPLKCFDDCEVPDSTKELIVQGGRWFLNSLLFFPFYNSLIKLPTKSKVRLLSLLSGGILDCLSWFRYLLILIIGLILLSFHAINIWSILLMIFLFYFDSGIGLLETYFFSRERIGNQNISNLILLLLLSPVREFIRSLAPFTTLYYLIKKIRGKGISDVFPKATRKRDRDDKG